MQGLVAVVLFVAFLAVVFLVEFDGARSATGHDETVRRLRALSSSELRDAKVGQMLRVEGVVESAEEIRSSRDGSACVGYQVVRRRRETSRFSDVGCGDFVVTVGGARVRVRASNARLALGKLENTDELLLERGDRVVVAGLLSVTRDAYRDDRTWELGGHGPLYIADPAAL